MNGRVLLTSTFPFKHLVPSEGMCSLNTRRGAALQCPRLPHRVYSKFGDGQMSGERPLRSHFLLKQHKAASSLRSIQRRAQDHSWCWRKKERRQLSRLHRLPAKCPRRFEKRSVKRLSSEGLLCSEGDRAVVAEPVFMPVNSFVTSVCGRCSVL